FLLPFTASMRRWLSDLIGFRHCGGWSYQYGFRWCFFLAMNGSQRGVIGAPERGAFWVRFLTYCLVRGFLLSYFTEPTHKMTREPNQGAATNRRPAGQSDGWEGISRRLLQEERFPGGGR